MTEIEDVGPADAVMNRDGRILIPKQLRQSLDIGPGATLVLSVEDGRLVMESRNRLKARIRREVADSWRGPAGTSAADDLLADRRAESAAEDEAEA